MDVQTISINDNDINNTNEKPEVGGSSTVAPPNTTTINPETNLNDGSDLNEMNTAKQIVVCTNMIPSSSSGSVAVTPTTTESSVAVPSAQISSNIVVSLSSTSDPSQMLLNPNPNTASTTVSQLSSSQTNREQQQQPQPPKKSLGLLAEVALKRHYEDMQRENENNENNKQKSQPTSTVLVVASKNKKPTATTNKKTISTSSSSSSSPTYYRPYTLKQVKRFTEKKLLATFAEYKRDIKTKRCTYRCRMLTECQQKFESFGAGQESKVNILQHLRQHVCNLEQTMPQIKLYSCRKTVKNETTTTVTGACGNKKKKSTSTAIAISSTITPTTVTMATEAYTVIKPEDQPALAIVSGSSIDPNQSNQMLTNQPPSNVVMVDISQPITTATTTALEQQQPATIIASNNDNDNKNYITLTTVTNVVPVQTYNQPSSLAGATAATVAMVPQASEPPIEDVQQTIEVIASNNKQQQCPTTQEGVRALALDYIEDIRKRSSSAAKSVIVNGDKSVIYQCKLCPDKQFTSTNGLIFHYKKHAGLKPYVCELCSSTFTRQHSLNYHMLIHLNKSRFVCSECSRQFRHPSHFKEHMRRHTGETPFQCGDCLIRFKTRNTYKRHLQTKHAKILTSKGIIEKTNDQSVPKNTSLTVATKGVTTAQPATATTTMQVNTIQTPGLILGNPQQPSTSTTTTIIKPRRKYGIRYLHKNIETITKYEQQFHQHHLTTAPATLIATNPATGIVHADPIAQALAAAGETAAIAPQPTSNITILSLQPTTRLQMPVQILDSSTTAAGIPTATPGQIATHHQTGAIARKTTLLNYRQQQQQQSQHLTLTPAATTTTAGQQQPLALVRLDEQGKPIFTTLGPATGTAILAASSNDILIKTEPTTTGGDQQQNIIELTSALPLTPSQPTTTLYHMAQQPIQQIIPQNTQQLNPNQLQQNQIQQQPQQIITTNDNFMRLLEAIELKAEEVES